MSCVIPQMPSARILHKSFLRGLCAESDDGIMKTLQENRVGYSRKANSCCKEQIPHKAAYKIDYRNIIVLAAFAE